MNVLAMDLATTVGFAVADSETYTLRTPLEYSAEPLPKPFSGTKKIVVFPQEDAGAFLAKYEAWLLDMLGVHQPQAVAWEAPWVDGKTNQTTAMKLIGMSGATDKVCYQRKIIHRYQANNSTLRKHFIGRGGGKRAEIKARVIAECQHRGWDVASDDEADALSVLDYAMHCLRPRRAA